MVVGLVIVVLSLIAASFCNTIPALIGTQGVLFAIGGKCDSTLNCLYTLTPQGILAYFPGMQMIDGWL